MDDFTTLSRVHHFKGTLITNSHTISMNRFSSSTTGQRHIDLGSSEVIATSAGWSYSGSNHTIDAGTSHLRFLGGSASFTGNLNHMYHHITFENSSGTNNSLRGPVEVQKLTFLGNGSITSSSNTIDTLVLSAGKNYAFQSGQTQTVNERLYASGNPCFILFMSSTTSGSPAFLNVLGGSLDFNYTNVRDIDASGSYGTLEMGPQSTDAGNNININFAPYDPDAEIEGFGDHLDLPCPLTPFTIYTDGFYPNPSTEFLWGDGSTADTLHITSFGTYTITVNYGEGCVVQDTLHVRPFDITPPVITGCPTDITQSNDSGICGAEVTWTEPIATDECMLDSLVSNFSPGDIFPIGTTTVTYTAYDANLNTATCSFDVTVNDTEAPVIVDCPTDITVNNDLGSCDAVVTWTAPTFTDNCTNTTLTSTHEPGDVFPVGTTTVTYTATDGEGNTATCSFEVTVNDTEAPVFVDFPSDTIVVCYGEVVDLSGIVVEDNCSGATLTSTHEPGDVFPIGTTTVTYTATDASGNQTDTSLVVVVNDFPAIEVVNISENNCLGDNISLEALFDSDLGSVDWYFGQTYLGSDATLFVEKTGTFDNGIYTAVITDNNGCVASDSIHIHLVLCEIVVSEVITPNGDGLNDYLVIEQLGAYPNTSIWIYNRWGAEVYHSDDYQNDWDGRSESKFNVGGDKLPESTYYYLIELGGPSDSETYGKIYKGYFYLKHE